LDRAAGSQLEWIAGLHTAAQLFDPTGQAI
jgi:hypothetical protein